MSGNPFEVMMLCDDSRTVRKEQHAVRLTRRDGREQTFPHRDRASAKVMIRAHEEHMAEQGDNWDVVKAELLVRTVTVNLGPWREPRDDDD